MSTTVSIHSFRGGIGKSNLVQQGKRVAMIDWFAPPKGLCCKNG